MCSTKPNTNNQLLLSITKVNTAVIQAFIILEDDEQRRKSISLQRADWNRFIELNSERPILRRHLRMSLKSFQNLLELIREPLEINNQMGVLRGGPIIPEWCLYIAIRYLAGGSYSDIIFHVGISVSSFYRILWKTLKILCSCPSLQVNFPSTEDDCNILANNSSTISYHGVIDKCCCAVDGYLLHIQTPAKREAKNVRSFFWTLPKIWCQLSGCM